MPKFDMFTWLAAQEDLQGTTESGYAGVSRSFTRCQLSKVKLCVLQRALHVQGMTSHKKAHQATKTSLQLLDATFQA